MMKKIVLGVAVVAAFGFTSCKKDYNCTCSFSIGANTVIPIQKAKKKDAKSTCENTESTYKLADPGVKCSL